MLATVRAREVSYGGPTRLRALRHILRSRFAEHPSIYLPFARVRYPGPSPEVIGPKTELVIDGYTRSACTFAVYAFQLAQPRPVRLAHHLHAPAQLIEAARRGVPAIVVIREPQGALLSQVIREPHVSMAGALVSYRRFYERLLPHASSLLAADFDEVTSDFGSVIRRANRRFDTTFAPFEPSEENVRRCFDLIGERPTSDPAWRRRILGFESGTVALDELLRERPERENEIPRETWIPSAERAAIKDELRERWLSPELATLRHRATAAYHLFVRMSGW
jgi:hypothetical protein